MSQPDNEAALASAVQTLSGLVPGDADAAYAALVAALDAGADPDAPDERGLRAIDILARGTDSIHAADAAFHLVERGAQASVAPSMQEGAALHAACFYGNPQIVQALLEAGVDPNGLSNGAAQNLMRGSALHAVASGFRAAAAEQYAECFRLLLGAGANIDRLDRRGDKPLDLAMQAAAATGDRTLVDAMLEFGVETTHDTPLSARNMATAIAKRTRGNQDLPAMLARSQILAVSREHEAALAAAAAAAAAAGEEVKAPTVIKKRIL